MHKRWLDLFPLLPGLGLLLFSGSCYVTMSERLVLDCDRTRDRCTMTVTREHGPVRARTLVGSLSFAASSLQRADYAPPRRRGRLRAFESGELVLRTQQGSYRFASYPLALADRTSEEAAQINRFIGDQIQQDLHVLHDTRPAWAATLGLPFMVGGFLVAKWVWNAFH